MTTLTGFVFLEQGRHSNKYPDDIHDHGWVGMMDHCIDGKENAADEIA
jgi:hypothetical protein